MSHSSNDWWWCDSVMFVSFVRAVQELGCCHIGQSVPLHRWKGCQTLCLNRVVLLKKKLLKLARFVSCIRWLTSSLLCYLYTFVLVTAKCIVFIILCFLCQCEEIYVLFIISSCHIMFLFCRFLRHTDRPTKKLQTIPFPSPPNFACR